MRGFECIGKALLMAKFVCLLPGVGKRVEVWRHLLRVGRELGGDLLAGHGLIRPAWPRVPRRSTDHLKLRGRADSADHKSLLRMCHGDLLGRGEVEGGNQELSVAPDHE